MRKRRPAVWPAMLLLASLFAPPARGQQIIPRIINGVPTEDFPSVGIVGTEQFGGLGSGTLISPDHVLTAAHVAELADGPTDGVFQLDGDVYTTSAIYIHPDYNSRTLENDVAIYELSQAVEGVTPSPIFRGVPQVGDELTLVGFGAGGDGASGQDGTFGVKMVGTTTIEMVTDTLIIWQFDSDQESNTAPGDSGGPGFLWVDGEYFIASITSSGTEPDAGFGDIATNMRVDAYAGWIDSVLEPAGEDGEPGPGQEQPGCPAGDHGHRPAHRPHPGHRPPHFHPAGRPGWAGPAFLRPALAIGLWGNWVGPGRRPPRSDPAEPFIVDRAPAATGERSGEPREFDSGKAGRAVPRSLRRTTKRARSFGPGD